MSIGTEGDGPTISTMEQPMLAAIPSDEDRALATFQLALRLAKDSRDIPATLESYFNAVLSQARSLADDPRSLADKVSPEAIQLALRLRETTSLREAVDNVPALSSVSPEIAGRILTSLEIQLAT